VLEQYYGNNGPDTRHEIYSCTKSFIATLIGIAIDAGYITSINQKVVDFFPDLAYDNPTVLKESMTLENVLTMSTGLDWIEGDPAYFQLYSSPDWVHMLINLC
jgi:CubicO group peptidase (beta-lactamase class C family)